MKAIVVLVLLALAGSMLAIRLAPSDPSRWHTDPLSAADPGIGGVRIVPPGAPLFATDPETLLAAFDAVAMAAPRVTRMAGSVAEGQITYVARSRLWGFPDYVTVRALPGEADATATLAVLSRLRFGQSDMGVNGARMAAWLGEVQARLGS